MARILFIHQIFVTPNQAGGTRHYELAKYLVQQGHQVFVIACRLNYLSGKYNHQQEEIIDGIHIFYCNAYQAVHKNILYRAFSFLSFSITSFFKALTIKKIDIVWGTSPPIFQSLTALVISKLRRKKFFYEVRDLWIDFAQELGVVKNSAVIFFIKMLEKVLYSFSDRIIINSPGFLPHIKTPYQKKISIIPNGVVTKDFVIQNQSKFFKSQGINSSFLAIYIGNLGIANDIGTIIETAKHLQNYSDIGIVLMGGGIKFKEIEQIIKTENLTNLHIFPAQKKSEIPFILSEVNIGIATLKNIPLFSTTYPNKVFDYMAAKKPTVLAIDGVIRDVIEKAKGGIFVPPENSKELADAILKYYQNRELVDEHGKNALSYVKKHFEREKIAKDLSNIFINKGEV